MMIETRNKEVKKSKIVVRHLPACLKEEDFKELIDGGFEGTYNYFYYCPGKITQKKHMKSRAYINFKDFEQVSAFCDLIHNHIFVDSKGSEDRSIAEFAPSQRIPPPRIHKDRRANTIEQDKDYCSFVSKLNNPDKPLQSAEQQLIDKLFLENEQKKLEDTDSAGASGTKKVIIAPLIESMMQKKSFVSQGRNRESRRNRRKCREETRRANTSRDWKKESSSSKIFSSPKRKDKISGESRRDRKKKDQRKQPSSTGLFLIRKHLESKTNRTPNSIGCKEEKVTTNYAVSEDKSSISNGKENNQSQKIRVMQRNVSESDSSSNKRIFSDEPASENKCLPQPSSNDPVQKYDEKKRQPSNQNKGGRYSSRGSGRWNKNYRGKKSAGQQQSMKYVPKQGE